MVNGSYLGTVLSSVALGVEVVGLLNTGGI